MPFQAGAFPECPSSNASGHLALVQYVDDPLCTYLHELRRLIPGKAQAPPHITVLPPRPLSVPLSEAYEHLQSVLDGLVAFDVHLSEVCHFPETNYLFLAIARGDWNLRDMHDRLNTGSLRLTEGFEFRPHLTLGGPVPGDELEAAQERTDRAWKEATCARQVAMKELICLWQQPGAARGDWVRCGSFRLRNEHGVSKAACAGDQDSKISS